jgi:hypothetical protein
VLADAPPWAGRLLQLGGAIQIHLGHDQEREAGDCRVDAQDGHDGAERRPELSGGVAKLSGEADWSLVDIQGGPGGR